MKLNIQLIDPISTRGLFIKDGALRLGFQITLGCGCPVCAGGRYDPANFDVSARLYRGDEVVSNGKVRYTGRTGEFLCHLPLSEPGRYLLEISGVDRSSGAAGRLMTYVDVAKEELSCRQET